MKNLSVLLLIFMAFGCGKESDKKEVASVSTVAPVRVPIIIAEGKSVLIDSVLLKPFGSKVLNEFYLATGYKSVWQSKKMRQIILNQFLNSGDDGLNPANFNVKKLEDFEKRYAALDNEGKVSYDILFTRSLQKYILQLTSGQLNSKYLYKDWDLKTNIIDVNETIAKLLKSDTLENSIEQLKPNYVVYKSLKKALKIINSFPSDDFKAIEIANKIVLNDTNSSLIAIKKRLIYWKDMKSKDSLSTVYDSETNTAMKKFQTRHGLSADGVIGKGTVDALNFSKRRRKEQILANLERWKWFPRDLGKEYVIVNIPDYRLSLVKDNDTVRTHKVVVGRDKRPTPVLSSTINQIVLNPTWTVPPTILKEDVIPAISKNRNYLSQTNIKVYDGSGNLVSASNWDASKAKSYRYVQSPGLSNSLGMVKINFPNRFAVYLHDTNHRDFFGKQKRSLSSGCVRVENPLKLAEYLLNDDANWNTENIAKILQTEKTKYIKMKDDVKVHILYWTAWSEGNTLVFRDDIYNLDSDLYRKLDK